ncbi:unnamed protein product [Bursaphelenchus xylophilus]|uniref:(pine wood nematode) hypothetical protein n=1 Tax=Bursaphelenchus xylophilus TaxID=6326 RepID=A0A811LX38_BURXY|nr:unnamed protein product [Bursaphelenchus xylophilus]CAG9124338.1 unnamed protein product [Bursaphelenchus xylophilus]
MEKGGVATDQRGFVATEQNGEKRNGRRKKGGRTVDAGEKTERDKSRHEPTQPQTRDEVHVSRAGGTRSAWMLFSGQLRQKKQKERRPRGLFARSGRRDIGRRRTAWLEWRRRGEGEAEAAPSSQSLA